LPTSIYSFNHQTYQTHQRVNTSHSSPSPSTFLPQQTPFNPPQTQSHPSLTSPTAGNSTYAGATAAIVANIVLLSYVVVAFNDDKSEREADLASGAIQPSEGRKDR